MQTYHRVHVRLEKWDRKQIGEMLKKGRESARVLRRALILRQLEQGQRAGQVARNVGVAPKTVRAIARRYEEEGLEAALYEKPRPGQPRRLDAGRSQRINYTPKHGSWLNQAEIEISLFSRQCLGRRRIPSLGQLQREARA